MEKKEEIPIKEEINIKEEVQKSKISLILDTYDDLFSDFDPRPYSERALSDDFLSEVRRAARDKKSGEALELIFSIPKDKRKLGDEINIKKRIREHFKKRVTEKEKEIKKLKKEGLTWIFIGASLMILAAILETFIASFTLNLLILVITPAGWFTFWEGLGKIFIRSGEQEPDHIFYKKMSNVYILFQEY